MASGSDNQGLQIAVIIFALLTIIMSGATFYVFKLSEDAELRAKAAEANAQKFNVAVRASDLENEELKVMIGATNRDPIDKVKELFDTAIKDYGGTLPDDRRNLIAALEENFVALNERNGEVVAERTKLNVIDAFTKKLEGEKSNTLATHEQQVAMAKDDLKAEQDRYAEQQKQNMKDKSDLADLVKKSRDELATASNEFSKKIQLAMADISKLENTNEGKQIIIDEMRTDDLTQPDGEIRWISARTHTVWIGIGRADGLRRQTSFSVYGLDDNGVARNAPKAKVEVTQVLGDHLAEARILEDTIDDPIIPGDLLSSPLFVAGRPERFAICGDIDIDGDEVSDIPMIRELIATHGGVLDAELMPDGTIAGEGMTVRTRFMILGEIPKAHPDAFGKMQDEANKLGVDIVSVNKFMDHVGYKEPTHPVRFGRYSDPKDFGYVPPNDVSGRAPTRRPPTGFRPRRLPGGSNNSAFGEQKEVEANQ